MGEKFGSLEECFRALNADHSQGVDSGEFATVLGCVIVLSRFGGCVVVFLKEDDVGITEEMEEWVPEVLGVEGDVCF